MVEKLSFSHQLSASLGGIKRRVALPGSIIGMIGQQNAQQTAPRIRCSVSETRSNLPVNVLALPSAASYQHHRNGHLSDVVFPDSLERSLRWSVVVIYRSDADRFVYDVVPHHPNKLVLVLLVLLMVVADEYVMPLRSWQSQSPCTDSNSVKSSTPAISASMRL